MEMNMDEVETKVPKCELIVKEDSKTCRCGELEERNKKVEERIVELELELEKRKNEFEVLEAKFKVLDAQKCAVEDELMAFRTRNNEAGESRISFDDENKASHRGENKEDVVVDLTGEEGEEDIVEQLVLENHVLECEKKNAESEVEIWREKFKALELWVSQVDGSAVLSGGKRLSNDVLKGENRPDVSISVDQLQINENMVDVGPTCGTLLKITDELPAAGTPFKDSPCGHTPLVEKKGVCLKSAGECTKTVSRRLSFEDKSPSKKMAPSTPGGSKPDCLNVINIFDSDDESDSCGIQFSISNDQGNKNVISMDHVVAGTLEVKKDKISDNFLKRAGCSQDHKEDLDDCKDNVPYIPTPKRKRAAKIVTSDTESDEDDNVPISKLKKLYLQELVPDIANSNVDNSFSGSHMNDAVKGTVTHSRRRLVTLRQCEEKVKAERSSSNKISGSKNGQGIPTTDDVEDGESEEVGSDSEGESLNAFIVDSSDVSDADNASSQSENTSDGNVDFDEILSKLQRSKDHKFKWELEADMLSAFGKDLELCMKAVCALYRQQTSEEQVSKETMYENNRGFSKFDALRGTTLAEFLTDGDPHGDLKKSVQQLKERGAHAVELCRTLASRYSKQLFEIYKNKEDPLFLPR
ncbi:hypothetical protein P3X46_023867 [Hevea brasiliensis]|uniref:Uncharacterized protein n=1 Tax=Hevea brasiliensis TaxID=3981 RepID=A0ABQ9LE27_HEVBR|nr:uncharacterized protein LOC110646699 [Hevea brasiliensis]KAJ9164267.1 hypothetical protein P3X46_023867 [Hevea brasiliensis]